MATCIESQTDMWLLELISCNVARENSEYDSHDLADI